MKTSLFEIFKVSIGPSSSHTMGPMLAAQDFGARDEEVTVHLYGSLALTGKGHRTDRAVLLGLAGESPDTVESLDKPTKEHEIVFHRDESMPDHPNGLRFETATRKQGYYSIGGGAIVKEGEASKKAALKEPPFPFTSAEQLLSYKKPIHEIALENELTWHTRAEIDAWLDRIWQVMQDCVQRGLATQGELPGDLHVRRRAKALHEKLKGEDPLERLDWLDAWAMAVNEENAAGGRVVTAPTNGAAGIIPSVAHYLARYHGPDNLRVYFLTAAVIGILYKENASISGADVGCQGEVGVASSMAAGGLTAALGGTNGQVEKAAEIAMEHNLGMTCDPIGGLVQIPCIERNAMGSVKAVNASRLALREDEHHIVSLDRVIKTMLETGRDMSRRYKETSLGGLAVSVPLC